MADSQLDRKGQAEFEQELRRQAQEAGCFGLLQGWAFSARHQKDICADQATHEDGPFICRSCLSDAVIRKCVQKRDHFAHHARITPAVGPGESELHQSCLREICGALRQRFPDGKWEVNREIPAKPEEDRDKVVPDISGRIGERRLVIEAQASFLSIQKIIKRSAIYTKLKIPILWLVPLKAEIGGGPFRPRLFERYFHSMYFGRVYYWLPGFGASVLPVHFGVASRHIPYAAWYDKEGAEEREAGGYDRPYKVIRRPVFADRIDIASQFLPFSRSEFRPWNERKTVPPLRVWQDRLQPWWDGSEDEAFLKRFKEDNLPASRRGQMKGARTQRTLLRGTAKRPCKEVPSSRARLGARSTRSLCI